MFKDRFTFRRKSSKDADAETSQRLPPPSGHFNQILPSSSQDAAALPHSMTISSASDFPKERSQSPAGGQDPLGLRVLYNPEGQRRADVVFVHGLGGTSRLTWSKNKDLQLFWPLEFLPLEPDICQARIMTFGYNSNFLKANTRNSATVLDFAKDLLYDLKYAQDEDGEELQSGNVPMVFLVHSMGGLIVKEAYMQGQYDPEYKQIVNAISAILFLSTPHRGTNLAETLNRILQASFISSPKQFVSELTKNSFTLQKLNEQFRHVAPDLDIISFYETQMTPIGISKTKIMVLEKDSSVLGYPGEISRALDADHHGVCKFDSPGDPQYVAVRNVLRSLISKLPSPGSGTARTTSRSEDLREIERLITVSEPPETDYMFFRDRWAPGTCAWILQEKAVIEWMNPQSTPPTRTLWLHGPAANGKSVLSSFVINHLVQNGISCHYFFVRFDNHAKRSTALLLRSLALQIAQNSPPFRQEILQLIAERTTFDNAEPLTIWNRVFKSILFKIRRNAPLYWVIDGLDELDDPRLLVKLMADVEHASMPIRVWVTSRKIQGLVSSFQRLSETMILDDISYESNSDDIWAFVRRDLEISGEANFQDSVKQQIVLRSQGNFLWAHLAVHRINNCHTEADIKYALEQLPSGMEALYDRMARAVAALQQTDDQKLALSILSWVTCAQRSLTVEELSQVLGKEISRPLHLQRSVGDLCGGFVVLDNDENLAMVHQTAREYLVGNISRAYSIDPAVAHERLFISCMDCLTDFGLRSKLARKQAPRFLDYAAQSWIHHLSHSSVHSEQIARTLASFFGNTYVLTWIQALAQANRLRVLVLVSNHLSLFANKRKENMLDPKRISETKSLEMWSTDMVKIVGKFGSNLLLNPDSIYKLIPPFCPRNSITYQSFGRKEENNIKVSRQINSDWDDSLARLSFGPNVHATSIEAAGGHIAVLSPSGIVILYYASTCAEYRRIQHNERVLRICLNLSSTLLVTYGFLTTKIWDPATGRCITSVQNPVNRPRPHTIVFTEDNRQVLVATDDRKVRALNLDSQDAAWEITAEINEHAFESTFVNSPTCMALSPDGVNVVLGYRGHPVSVWELQGPELVGHCLRVLDNTVHSNASHSWGEVIHVTWHPYSGEVIGLYLEGVVFRWHPYHDETYEIRTGANSISISQNAKCLATGDPNGVIQLYSLANFKLVYQFASQDPVFDLCFAPDSRRLYDVRGSYANVWEPAALLRLSESTEGQTDTNMPVDTAAHSTPGRTDPVVSLSASPSGGFFCSGSESGVVRLFDSACDEELELQKFQSLMSVEHISWSVNGEYVALSDLSGRIYVRHLYASSEMAALCKTDVVLDFSLRGGQGPITQLLFSRQSDRLLISTGAMAMSVLLSTGETIDIREMSRVNTTYKWLNHPVHEHVLMAVGPGNIVTYSWSGLVYIAQIRFPMADTSSLGSISQSRMSSSTNLLEAREYIDRVLVTASCDYILVQTSFLLGQGQKKIGMTVLDTSNIPCSSEAEASNRPSASSAEATVSSGNDLTEDLEDLAPLFLPSNLLSQVEHPLTFLSNSRLIFLDHNFWLCSWRLPLPTRTSAPRRPSAPGSLDASTTEIKRHFFLPGDWISPDAVSLCTLMDDGTLLCPRNGEVAVVKCASLKA